MLPNDELAEGFVGDVTLGGEGSVFPSADSLVKVSLQRNQRNCNLKRSY